MDFLVSLMTEVASYTIVPIGRQAGYLLFYKSNFKKLVKHFKVLEATRIRINHSIEDEKRNGKEIETDVLNWLKEVEELIQQANQLQNDPGHANAIGCSIGGGSFPNLKLCHQLSRKAVKIAKDVIELLEKGTFDRVSYEPAPDEIAFSSNVRSGGEILETRESFKKEILKALKDCNAQNVGVYGLGGVGKTTLVEEVALVVKQDKLFHVVVKARVSESPNIKEIQKEIAELLGLHFNDESTANRAYRLRNRIKTEKTILVILDDIWTKLDLEKVGIPSSDQHNGCKLLVTSRNEDVLLQMGIRRNSTFRLELLNEPEAWSLFKYMVGDIVKDIGLQSIAIQLAKKCGGLPLGIATLAGTLRDQDIYIWEDALRQLEICDHEEHDAKLYSMLELSYNYLKSREMKEFFLLFAVIGDDLEYCLIVGIGLGIFRDVRTVRDARIRLRRIISSLEASCLLLEDKSSKQIQMHDRVREVAISIARRVEQVFMVKRDDELKWPTNDFMRSCLRIILDFCNINVLPQTLDCPHIKLFYLSCADRSLKIPDTFFEGMESLEVLDLTGMNLSVLPMSFQSLTSLKALCLDCCVLENMDAIGDLISLEILGVRMSSINQLPRKIEKLTELRMLDLSNSRIEVVPPNIISSLTKLEELKMGNTSIEWEYEFSSNKNKKASLVELDQLSNLTGRELQIREAWILPRRLQLTFERLTRYKIAIGDVWEWSDIEGVTLNTLMLKLGTNIHLEHEIKALIEGVENLYLDEVDGIQNVLYQLNLKGFPLLKHLNIQNNAKIKHIVDSKERNQVQVSFPNLETLALQNLKNLEQIYHGPLVVNSFGKLSVIKVKNCVQLKYLLSFSMVKRLFHLSEIEVCRCNYLKQIVHIDNDSSANDDITNEKVEFLSLRSLTLEHLKTLDSFFSYEFTSSITEGVYQRVENRVSAPLFGVQVVFPNLDTLKLSSLNLNKIWDDNQHSLDKLTNLIVENCGGLKYLFSSTDIGSFKSLKRLEISNCDLMEEIIAIEEVNSDIGTSEEVVFFKLETVVLKDMRKLKTVWHHQFERSKMLQVNNCEKVAVVFPSSIQKSYVNLEMMEVTNCAFVKEIFDRNGVEDRTHVKGITLKGLPKLEKIWSKETLAFGNLENVNINMCERLEYLFPFYVATCCSHLIELHINYCENMKEIVAEKKEPMGISTTFDFNHLKTLLLWNMPKLKGFYTGNHTLECASLRDIDVSRCDNLILFKTLSPNIVQRSLHGKQRPPFILEQVIPNLENLKIHDKDADMILQAQNLGVHFTKLTYLGLCFYKNEEVEFPYCFLENVHTLKSIVVEWCSFRKIFQEARLKSEKIHTRLKSLTLNQIPKLEHICEEGYQIDPVLEFLEFLFVDSCNSLTNLLPSSVTFCHLTYMEIESCNTLVNLFTSSTARSLVKLITMKIKYCDSIEEIVTGENVDIAFISLQILILERLPKLYKFCSGKGLLKFPVLEEVVIRECPRLKIFSEGYTSSPILKKVKITENDEEFHWKRNLNETVQKMFEDKVAFCSFEILKLSEFPELRESWYGQLQHNAFKSLKYLVVHKCDCLSSVLFQPSLLKVLMSLEELDITDCNSLETVFDLEDQVAKEIVVTNSQLKKLTLSNLPKLKQVWKEELHITMRFQNICEVSLNLCKSLTSLFPLSIARDIMQLQNLYINSCGIEEIVSRKEGTKKKINFEFPHLTTLTLSNLPILKAFFVANHSLQCDSLNTINVYGCPKLALFKTEDKMYEEIVRNDKLNVSTYQPLFIIDEVLANMEIFTLNSKDYAMLLQSGCSGEEFKNLKNISVFEFGKEEASFPYCFVKNIASLETLEVECSSFKEIFPCEQLMDEEKEIQIRSQIKNLRLLQLHELQNLCKEGFTVDPILQCIESIYVDQCSKLINLVPSSITFACLTYLEVTNCSGLKNLITSSTAKSLGKLTMLKIKQCNLLEVVVNENENETNNEIQFFSLEVLELVSLPRFRSFCTCMCPIIFPVLEKVVSKDCPRLEAFAFGETISPYLQNVQIDENGVEYRWEGDLNRTIKKMFDDKVAFCKFEYMALSEFPELKDLWYGQLHDKLLCNLKSLVVQRCNFLSHVLLPSNVLQMLHRLENLEVTDCDSLETVFDVKGIKAKAILTKQSTQLKRLTLSGLPKLKHIWNEDPYEFICLENLCLLSVSMCQSLLYIFSLPLCQDLGRLEVLAIQSCGIEEIIGMADQSTKSIIFNFPRLIQLQLYRLTMLKSFYPKKHTLECPSLKTLDVYRCGELKMFSFNHLGFQEPIQVNADIHYIPSGQALFSIEVISPNLKQLAINDIDALRLLDGHLQKKVFHNIEFLHLQCFDETPYIFWDDFHAMFPSLETFQVRNSSFEILFPTKDITNGLSLQVSKPIQKLLLYELEKLKYIWNEDFPSDHPLLQDLEELNVMDCQSLICLAPSSSYFTNLIHLRVDNCKELAHLITSSTAKSLLQLRTLTINNCEKMLDVVKINEDREKEDIIFENLEYLEITSLSSLRSFSYGKHTLMFSSLVLFIVKGCHQMKIFSSGVTIAPFLTSIEVEDKEKWWKDDLNLTIKQLFKEQVISHSNDN